jgi:hypothetical protein
VGQKAEVADAHEARGKHVEQEAAQELLDRQGHQALLVAVHRVSPAEGNLSGRLKFLRVDHGQREFGIVFLFSDGREDPDTAISNFQGGLRTVPLRVSHLDSM